MITAQPIGQTRACSEAPRPQPVVFNRARLAVYTLGDSGLEREVMDLFLGQIGELLQALHDAHDPKAWHSATHTLKGSAATVGADAIARAASDAERMIKWCESRKPVWAITSGDQLALGRDEAESAVRRAVADFIAEWANVVACIAA